MHDYTSPHINETVESLRKYSSSLLLSINLARLIGYGLLILAAIDFIEIFVGARFTQPTWEFELIGQLVDRVAVPLIGIALVCLGQQLNRLKFERLILRVIAWILLLVVALYLLLIPLNIVSGFRIDRESGREVSARVSQTAEQLQQAQAEVKNLSSLDQARQLLSQIDPSIQSEPDATLAEVQEQLTATIGRQERRLKNQVAALQRNQRRNLIKNAAKWNIGALISATLFLLVWRNMAWARSRTKSAN